VLPGYWVEDGGIFEQLESARGCRSVDALSDHRSTRLGLTVGEGRRRHFLRSAICAHRRRFGASASWHSVFNLRRCWLQQRYPA
jgi:hypothetical protein